MSRVYGQLGIVPVINAPGEATRLGDLSLSKGDWNAIRRTLSVSVRRDEFASAAGLHIAQRPRVPAAYVTSGASAALALAAAICVAGEDRSAIDALPDTGVLPLQVVIQSAQMDPHDRAITSVGVGLTGVGYRTCCMAFEPRNAPFDRCAAALFRPGEPGDLLSLGRVAAIAHERSLLVASRSGTR